MSDTQLGKWKKGEKDATPVEAPILMIRKESYNPRKRPAERNNSEVREIMFPPLRNISSADPVIIKAYVSGTQVNKVYLDGGSSCEVIYEHCFLKLKPSIWSLRVDSTIPLVGFSGEKSWPLGEVPLEITIGEGIVVSIIHGAIKFYTSQGISTALSQYNPKEPEEEQRATSEEHQEKVKCILSCIDTGERIVVNDQHPKQTIAIRRQLPTKTKIRLQDLLRTYADVFAWTTAHMTGVLRTVTIGGEAFNTEHRINELKHLEPVKQKKRSLAPERNKAIHTQVEELTKANILREVRYQTWVSNPVIVKKASKRWNLCVDFTDINKACPKEHHSLPMIEQKVKDLHRHRLKCFLDAYKGYHQIPIA
ncbi:hypothetical protein Tco_0903109 [Tanacetum coccineum]